MSLYIDRANVPPVTFTDAEREKLLRVTGRHRDGMRDHTMYSLGFGTGLRLFELVALNVGDVTDGNGVKQHVVLRQYKGRKEGKKPPIPQEVVIPDSARYKLRLYLAWKARQRESCALEAALFCAKGGVRRLSRRAAQERLVHWQREAGFERLHNFHQIRHTCLTRADRDSGHNLRLVQRVGRHASLQTTARYVHPSDEEILKLARGLPC